jgi:PAS domain S-box-containing protein
MEMAAVEPQIITRQSDDDNPTAKIVAAQQVAVLFNQAYVAIFSSWIAAFLFAAVLWPVVGHTKILAWMAIFSLVSIGRMLLSRMFRHADPEPDKYLRWRDRAVISSGIGGIAWGLAGTMLFPEISLPHQMFLGCMLAGIVAASIPYQSAVWPAYVAMLVPTVLPYSMRMVEQNTPIAQTMAILMILFAMAMLYASRKMNATLAESLSLRYDKQVLAECLGQTVDELDIANAVREQAKRVARESEQRVQILADAPFEGIFIHENGKILDANKTLLSMLNISLDEALGKRIVDFVPADAFEMVDREIEQPSGQVFVTNARRSDGSTVKLEVRGRKFPYQGRLIRVVSLRPIA